MHLRPVHQNELPAFAHVMGLAMWDDELTIYTAPDKDRYPDSYIRFILHRAKNRWYRGELLFYCVSDSDDADWTGEEVVMGYCAYSTNVPTVPKPQPGGWLGNNFESWALDFHERYTSWFGLDWSRDQAAVSNFRTLFQTDPFENYFKSLTEMEGPKKRLGGDGKHLHWKVELLGTHPDFRRRGVGKKMLEWGFARANEDGVPLVLVGTIVGKKLYLNAGFRDVGNVDVLFSEAKAGKPMSEARQKLNTIDLGLGIGKGIRWFVMAWEPSQVKHTIDAARPQQSDK